MTPGRAYFQVKDRRTARTLRPPRPASSPSPPPASRWRQRLLFGAACLLFLTAALGLYSRLAFALGVLAFSLMISFLLEPFLAYFERAGWSRFTGILIIFLLLAAITLIAFPPFARQLGQEVETLSSFFASKKPEQFGTQTLAALAKIFPWLQNANLKQKLLSDYLRFIAGAEQSAAGIAAVLLTSWLAAALSAVFAFILLVEAPPWRRAIIDLVPNQHWGKTVLWLHTLPGRLSKFLRVQIFAAIAVAVIMTFAFYLMRAPCFLLLGLIAGLASLTPYFGSLVGTIFALVLVVIGDGAYSLALPILIAFATVDLIKNLILSSRALKAGSVLGPLETLLGLVVGGNIAGVWGLFCAAPLLGAIKILVIQSLRLARDFHARR